jgi:hypothetical protein
VYTGHFGVALGAAGLAPRLPLGWLILAAFGGDLVEGVVALAGVDDPTRVWSHSLPATVGIGLALGLLRWGTGGRVGEALLLTVVGATHTPLDLLTAVKAWWPGQPPVGLGLYERPLLEGALELLVISLGWWVWQRRRTRPDAPRALRWAPLLVLVAAQLAGTAFHLSTDRPADPGRSKFIR